MKIYSGKEMAQAWLAFSIAYAVGCAFSGESWYRIMLGAGDVAVAFVLLWFIWGREV